MTKASESTPRTGSPEIETEGSKPTESAAACPVCLYPHPSKVGDGICADARGLRQRRFAPLEFIHGFGLFMKSALAVIHDREYVGKIKWPVALSFVVLAALAALLFWLVWPAAETVVGDWLADWASAGVTLLAVLLVAFFAFPVVISVSLAPVLDPIAKIAERERLGFEPPASQRGNVAEVWDGIDTGARILLYQGLAWLLTFPLLLLPFGPPISILVAAFFAGFAWLDYPASRRGLRWPQKWRRAKKNWALLCGYGCGFFVGLMVPFFNPFFVAPAAAAGSMDLWLASAAPSEDDIREQAPPEDAGAA